MEIAERLRMYTVMRDLYADPCREKVRELMPGIGMDNVGNVTYSLMVSGICSVIHYGFGVKVYRDESMAREFPELHAAKPKKMYGDLFWFKPGNTESRRELLDAVILKMSNTKTNKK